MGPVEILSCNFHELNASEALIASEGNSVMGLVERGLADFTEPDMYLLSLRATRMKYIGTTMTTGNVWIYKPETSKAPRLSVEALPISLYSLILFIALAFLLIRYWLTKWFVKLKLDKFFNRNKVLLLLFYGVFLKLVGSHFVLLFGQLTAQGIRTFKSTLDVIDALDSGEYTGVAVDGNNYDHYILNPVEWEGELFQRMVDINRRNKAVIVSSVEDAMELILNPPDNKKYILVDWDRLLPKLRSHYCGFVTVPDDMFGFFSSTVFYANNTKIRWRRWTMQERKMFYKVTKILELKYYPKKVCAADTAVGGFKGYQALRLNQVQIVFWLYLFTLGLGSLVVLLEFVLANAFDRNPNNITRSNGEQKGPPT